MKKHVYRVSGFTKLNGLKKWVYDIEADNKKEAREKAVMMWETYRPHLFKINVECRDDKELEFNFWHRVETSLEEYFSA